MKRNNLYYLTKYNGYFFLLPTGQASADLRHSFKISSIGAYLWDELEHDISIEKLTDNALYVYGDNVAKETLINDIQSFINILKTKNLVIDDDTELLNNTLSVEIAKISISIHSNEKIIIPSFDGFEKNIEKADISVYCHTSPPSYNDDRVILIKNREALISESLDSYFLEYTEFKAIREIRISKNFARVDVYYHYLHESFSRELFLALRTPLILMAQKKHMLMLHSSSVLYNDRLLCFSAPSSTGKSTHANHWNTLFNADIINGDLNLIEVTPNTSIVHGTPWCGTSNIYSNQKYTLGAVIFLSQGSKNTFKKLSNEDSFENIVARTITPSWNKTMIADTVELASSIIKTVPFYSFSCTKDESSAVFLKEMLDIK